MTAWRIHAHGLHFGVGVGDDLEVDLRQALLPAVPEGVRLQGRALALRVVREVERAISNGLPVVPADAVRPDLVEVLPRERSRRIERAEQALPVGERTARIVRGAAAGRARLPVEGDRLRALVRDAADLVVARATREIVLRVDDLLPRVREVRPRDRDLLAAPVPVRLRADGVGQRRLRGRARDDNVLDPLALVVLEIRAVQRFVGGEITARERVATGQVRVEAVDVLLLTEDENALRLPTCRRPRHVRP